MRLVVAEGEDLFDAAFAAGLRCELVLFDADLGDEPSGWTNVVVYADGANRVSLFRQRADVGQCVGHRRQRLQAQQRLAALGQVRQV